MGIEHVYVVYDPTTTNRFDLGGRKLVRGIELTHFQPEDAANAAANALLAVAHRAAMLQAHANDASNAAGDIADLAAAEAAARAAAAAALEAQLAWEDLPQQDYGADAEDHTGGGGDTGGGDSGDAAAAAAANAAAAAAAAAALLPPVIQSFVAREEGAPSGAHSSDTFFAPTFSYFEILAVFNNQGGYGGTPIVASLELPDGGFATGQVTSGIASYPREVSYGTSTYTLHVTNDNGTVTRTLTVTGN